MKIDSAELACIAVRTSQYPIDNLPEFLLVGRSNVGKSSFINTIINRKNLARTSSKPGKTQTLNFYLANNEFYLVDVPGYGYANVSKAQQKKFGLMIEEYLNDTYKDISFKEKLYWYFNDITTMPVCKNCGKPVKFINSKIGYAQYCCVKCSNSSKEKIEK